jgi:predicted Ser/Thr protein kinase
MIFLRRLRELLWADEPEPLTASHFHRGVRPLLWVGPLLILLSVASRLVVPREGFDAAAYDRFLLLSTLGHLLYVAVVALALRSDAVGLLKASVCIVIVLLHWTTLTMNWAVGGESSLPILLLLVTIAFYRGYFDAKIGLFTLVAAIVMLATLDKLQSAGWLRVNAAYPSHARPSTSFVMTGLYRVLILAFIGVSYATNRVRGGDRALAREKRARRSVEAKLTERELGRLSGSVIAGAYDVLELLGRGAMGEVYAAKRRSTGEDIAIKVLHLQYGRIPEAIERFRREAEALGRLPSKHVPRVHEIGTSDDGDHFIVMDRLEGEDFASLLRRRGFLSVAEVARFTTAIAAALDAAHDAGLIHRDLKPQNVFVVAGEDFGIRLLDFGVSRWIDPDENHDLTRSEVVVGSPGYLAPEQALGALEKIGAHTDVFALGAIVYRALTGENAFPSRNAAAAVYEAVHLDPPPPSKHRPIAADVDLVVALALAKDIAMRYSRARELASDLELAKDGLLSEETRTRARSIVPASDGGTLMEPIAAPAVA